jgi:hypothetical protein
VVVVDVVVVLPGVDLVVVVLPVVVVVEVVVVCSTSQQEITGHCGLELSTISVIK